MSASLRRVTSPLAACIWMMAVVSGGCESSNGDPPAADAGAMGGRGGGTGGTIAGGGGTGGGSVGGAGGSASDAGNQTVTPLTTYMPCQDDKRSGEIIVERAADFTSVAGNIRDGVEINQVGVPKPPMMAGVNFGACKLMQPPPASAPCSPVCSASQNCVSGTCQPKPTAQDVGTMTMTGLLAGPITLKFTAGNYINPPGMTPHPLFGDGANILLSASGGSGFAPFTLKGFGVEAVQIPQTKLLVESGKPVVITWTPPKNPGPAKMLINFSLNRHGATDSWLDCLVDDNGSYMITGDVTRELFSHGVSGFPSVQLIRHSMDQTMVKSGCVHMQVKSEASRELEVPGVKSCTMDTDCTPRKCRADLTCEPAPAR